MPAPPLRVAPRPAAPRPVASRGAAGVVGCGVLLFGMLATWLGADEGRRRIDIRQEAGELTQRALRAGSADPEVRARLREFRRRLALRPLDARARVVYASLILGLGRSVEDLDAVRFHAERAARFAPVTVPVVRSAALLLARAGEPDAALRLTRRMFSYAPGPAADLLLDLRALVFPSELDRGLPNDPDAWSAWFLALRREGNDDEADLWLDRAHERWPTHLPVLQNLAARALRRDDRELLERLFPPALELPDDAAAAPVLAYRARLHAMRGEVDAARADLARALTLGGDDPAARILVGEGFEALGDVDAARKQWNAVLFSLPGDARAARLRVLLRLGRLESRHGEPAVALRLWRNVLELDPENDEARRRIRALTGG